MNASEQREVSRAALASVLANPDSFKRARAAEAERDAEQADYAASGEAELDASADRVWRRLSHSQREQARRGAVNTDLSAARWALANLNA